VNKMSFLEIATAMIQRGIAVTPTYSGLRSPAMPGWNGKDDWYAASIDPNRIAAWNNQDTTFI